MKLGAISFMTDASISAVEIAQALEAHGFESFWAGDHSHIPVVPGGGPPIDTRTGRPVPDEYARLLDPFVALTAAAVTTSRLRLGTGIYLVNERDPIHTAKSVASLDHVSAGRFLFGVGGGWNALEMANHGVDISDRWPALRERILAMREVWENDVAAFSGDHVSFGPMLSRPKPERRIPVLIGGNWRNIARVVEYGDAWCPGTPDLAEDDLRRVTGMLWDQAATAGRTDVTLTAFHVTSVVDLQPGDPRCLTPDRFALLADVGAERVVVVLPPGRDDCLRMIEHYARTLPDRMV
ncbi:LLM class F420-dependent oxidoreductase [Monashia sp. NPDC004114]